MKLARQTDIGCGHTTSELTIVCDIANRQKIQCLMTSARNVQALPCPQFFRNKILEIGIKKALFILEVLEIIDYKK